METLESTDTNFAINALCQERLYIPPPPPLPPSRVKRPMKFIGISIGSMVIDFGRPNFSFEREKKRKISEGRGSVRKSRKGISPKRRFNSLLIPFFFFFLKRHFRIGRYTSFVHACISLCRDSS